MKHGPVEPTLAVQSFPVDAVKPYHRNPRRGVVSAIADSLRARGQYRPIVVNVGTHTGRPLEVLAGNHTLQAAVSIGWERIEATTVDVDDEHAAQIVLADNRLADLGDYDDAALLAVLQSVDELDGTGYTDTDIAALLHDLEELESKTDPDSTPDPPSDPISVVGDLWELGPHRLFCGDSTDVDSWDQMLGGVRPDLVFTDPPYGIGYQAMRGGAAIKNDANEGEAIQVTRDALSLFSDVAAHFVCCDWRSLPMVLEAMRGSAIEPKATIVWDKGSRVQNLDRYAKQHEFIVYAGPYGGQPTQCSDVWLHARDFVPNHPTPKPVGLIEQAITTATKAGQVVVDSFAGSGSTLIAAHRTGRVARVVELDPGYADVICRRFEEHTGIVPKRAGESVSFTS